MTGKYRQLTVIPEGPTSQLQPLHVSISKPFKVNMRGMEQMDDK